MARKYGRADLPVFEPGTSDTSDHLSMTKYASALARFVSACETPMTVGIQGEWGSGKTSLMNMVHATLLAGKPSNVHLFKFQTWQYGALNQDEILGLLLMKSILMEFARARTDDDRIKWLVSRLGKVVASVAKSAVFGVADKFEIDGKALLDEFASDSDPGADLRMMRTEFAKLVSEMTQEFGRVVVFIDDLDRVRPARAVAMLEIIKNFMDVNNCIFVVACDYDVVQRGVSERLGVEESGKAEAFFHKLIQVPFSMPTATYNTKEMLKNYLQSRFEQPTTPDLVDRLNPLIQCSIGTNPRSFKRFLNRVDLHACIKEEDTAWSDETAATALIGVVALQYKWPEIAAHLSLETDFDSFKKEFERCRNLIGDEVASDSDSKLVQLVRSRYEDPETDIEWFDTEEIRSFNRFMNAAGNMLKADVSGRIENDILLILHNQFTNITVTMVGPATGNADAAIPNPELFFYERWQDPKPWERGLMYFATRFFENRAKYQTIQVHRDRRNDVFMLKTKGSGRKSILTMYDGPRLYVYLGENAAEYYNPSSPDIEEEVTRIAVKFRTNCERAGVPFTNVRNGASCRIEMNIQQHDKAKVDGFFKSLEESLGELNTAFAKME